MKIYFCDGCNESIPLADIQAGQVTTIKGKLFCRNCIPPGAGGGAAGPPTVVQRGTHPLIVLLLLALIAYVVWRDLPAWRHAVAPGGGDSEAVAELHDGADHRIVEALQADVARLKSDKEELQRSLTSQRSDLDAARGTAADLQRGVDQQREEIDGLQRGQAETGQLIEKLHLQENRTQALEKRIDALADMLTGQEQALAMGLSQHNNVAADQPAAPAADATQQAALDAIRHELLDADAGRRFEAVDKILKGRFKQLAPDLLPMLKDEDAFVRMRAMQALGDFGDADAIQPLFDILDDPSVTLRKAAAEQLVRLTGYKNDPPYDPRASKPERDKFVKKWRDWVGSH